MGGPDSDPPPIVSLQESIISAMTFLAENHNNNSLDNSLPKSPVVNLSSIQLTEPMINLLSKGLNFCPTPGEPDVYQLRQDMDRFHLSLKRKLFLKENYSLPKMRPRTLNPAHLPSAHSFQTALRLMAHLTIKNFGTNLLGAPWPQAT
jgi:hypothetical protein